MESGRVAVAAANNAAWCEAVCRSHGAPGTFRDGLWLNLAPVPPLYPNALTLAGPARSREQLQGIRELLVAGIAGCAVKDSFHALDLAPLGFEILFEATWIFHPPLGVGPALDAAGAHWSRIGCPADLAAWEGAWRGASGDPEGAGPAPLFRPALLDDPDIAVLAAYHDAAIVAGAVANRAAGAVGLSNLFGPAEALDTVWASAVGIVAAAFPGLPIVGYESADRLGPLKRVGFEVLAPLRVWLRTTEHPD